jgi:hypothetical protein
MTEIASVALRWQSLVGHRLAVVAGSASGLPSCAAHKSDVSEPSARKHPLAQTNAEPAPPDENILGAKPGETP